MMTSRMGAIMRTGGAAVASQLVMISTLPIASRLFEPAAFGVLGLFISLANILSILSHLGYSDAIIAVDEDRQADNIMNAIFWMSFVSLLPIGLMTWLIIRANILGYGDLPDWMIFVLPVQAAGTGLVFALQQRIMRAQLFNVLAVSHLALGFVRAGGQLLMGLLFATPASLVSAELASRLATIAAVLRARTIWQALGHKITVDCWKVLYDFRAFATMRSASTILNTINVALPTLIVAQYFDIDLVGSITFAIAVLFAPLGLIQKAIGDVFTGTYRSALRTDIKLAQTTFFQVLGVLTIVSSVILVVLLTSGEVLFTFVFGEKWALSGRTAEIFAPMLFLMTIIVPLSSSLNILRKAGATVLFNVLRLFGLIAAFAAVPILDLPYIGAVHAMAFSVSISYLIFGVLVLSINLKVLYAKNDTIGGLI